MEDALAHPIGAGLLAEEIHAGDTVCILTNDITRLTRSHIYIPILVRELNKAGVPDGDITILFANGMHSAMTEEQMCSLITEDIYRRVTVVQHDCEESPCQLVGNTSYGHEVWANKIAMAADKLMINNAKYGGKSILPELRVIESGVLKGFVTISPKWAGFKAADYLQASMSVYTDDTYYGQPAEGDATFEVAAGDFDLRGFEVTNSSLFDANKRPYVLFQSKQIKFSTDCVRQFGKDNKVELLIHPGLRKLAVRRASKDSRQCVQWSRPDDGKYYAKEIPCTAFGGTLFELLDWETDFKFRAYGRLLQNEGDSVFIFDLSEPEIFIQSYLMTGTDSPISGDGELSPLSVSGKRVRAVPKKLADRFGSDFYSHRLTSSSPELQSEDAWKLWLEGQLFETGEKLRVTKFDEMQRFIAEQLAPIKQKDEVDFNA